MLRVFAVYLQRESSYLFISVLYRIGIVYYVFACSIMYLIAIVIV